jgi:hypothetical protein
LALKWETFKWLQVPGFMLLIYGTLVFNDVVAPPCFFPRQVGNPVVLFANPHADDETSAVIDPFADYEEVAASPSTQGV